MDRLLLLFWSLAVVCSSFTVTVVTCNTEVTREFLDALREIESVGAGGVCAVGDSGRSLGAYQIMNDYHTDAVQQNPDLAAGGIINEEVYLRDHIERLQLRRGYGVTRTSVWQKITVVQWQLNGSCCCKRGVGG